jgi:predicted nucleic acid-binding protein
VLNALLTAERKNRITSAAGHEFLADILTMPFVPEIPDAGRVHSIEDLCRKHALTAYDAAYLELAIRLKLPLASFDNALLRASRAEAVPTA